MNTNQCDIGLIGLAVMGENLALNLESKGFSVAVFNRTTEVTEKFAAGRASGKNIQPMRTLEEFVAALKKAGKTFTYITYPREGHGFQEREHRKDSYERQIAFLNKYLKPDTVK